MLEYLWVYQMLARDFLSKMRRSIRAAMDAPLTPLERNSFGSLRAHW
jgi:hypothetical protein